MEARTSWTNQLSVALNQGSEQTSSETLTLVSFFCQVMSKKRVIYESVPFLTDENVVTLINTRPAPRSNEVSGFNDNFHNNVAVQQVSKC